MFETELLEYLDADDYEAAINLIQSEPRINLNYINPENNLTFLATAVMSDSSLGRNAFVQTLLAQPRFILVNHPDADMERTAFELAVDSADPKLVSIFIDYYQCNRMHDSGMYQYKHPEALVYVIALENWFSKHTALEELEDTAKTSRVKPDKMNKAREKESKTRAIIGLICERTLRYAIATDNVDILKALDKKNASIATPFSDGTDPIALARGNPAVSAWYRGRGFGLMDALLAHGALTAQHQGALRQNRRDALQDVAAIAMGLAGLKV